MDVVHTIHPDSHDEGLADGCPRCAQHAADPFAGLDDRNLQVLIDRTLRDRFGSYAEEAGEGPFGCFAPARSDAEAEAMRNVMTRLEQVGQVFRVAPDLVALYLRERWNVTVPS